MTPVTPMTPESQNHAQNKDKTLETFSKSGDNDSGMDK